MTRATPALRAAVFARDGQCVLAKLDDAHICRDTWGQPHLSTRTYLLTLEHVKRELRMGLRAENTMGTMVAMCMAGNLGPPTKVQRQAIRAYLEEVSR